MQGPFFSNPKPIQHSIPYSNTLMITSKLKKNIITIMRRHPKKELYIYIYMVGDNQDWLHGGLYIFKIIMYIFKLILYA